MPCIPSSRPSGFRRVRSIESSTPASYALGGPCQPEETELVHKKCPWAHDNVRLQDSLVTPVAALRGDDIVPRSNPETMHKATLGRASQIRKTRVNMGKT